MAKVIPTKKRYRFFSLQRIRTNILGNKKRSGKAESGRLSPLATTFSPSLEDLGEMRSRVTSISGKAIRAKGMAVKFGDSSSGNVNKLKVHLH